MEGRLDERIEELRWRFEELRVSLVLPRTRHRLSCFAEARQQRWNELGL